MSNRNHLSYAIIFSLQAMDVLEIGWGINFEPAWATVALGFGKSFSNLQGLLPRCYVFRNSCFC